MDRISLILIFTLDLFFFNNAIPFANNTPVEKNYVLDAFDPPVIIITGGSNKGMYCLYCLTLTRAKYFAPGIPHLFCL